MSKLSMTGKQFEAALQYLEEKSGWTVTDFCKHCNCHRSNQTHWRKNGITGSIAVLMRQLLKKQWYVIKREVE